MSGCALGALSLAATPATAAASGRPPQLQARPTAAGAPRLRLIAAHANVSLIHSQAGVSLDPGILVASLGSDFRLDVQRATYSRPITVDEVLRVSGNHVRLRRLPSSVLDGWGGLAHFFRFVVTDARGRVVMSGSSTFCPNAPVPLRVSPHGPLTDAYPQYCSKHQNPFQLSSVWGIRQGWASDLFLLNSQEHHYALAPGRYRLSATISRPFRRLFAISRAEATATVRLRVVDGVARKTPPSVPVAPTTGGARPPLMAHPPRAALPDLVALPAWKVRLYASGGRDFMTFAATLWDRNAPLDVQGFRTNGSRSMRAYQYFWLHGRAIGRARAGTMGFDNGTGQQAWDFGELARYDLLGPRHAVVATDPKVGFCLGPGEAIDLELPHVSYRPPFHEPDNGCGRPANLSVDEELPPGWGDSYLNSEPSCSLLITGLPNGTYQIRVAANPLGLLQETTTSNDTALRTVILGGTPGNRTAVVPPWRGLDPEKVTEAGYRLGY